MGLSLTNSDVLSLLNERSVESKLLVAQEICKDYAELIYSREEIIIAEEIFRIFVQKSEVKIRAAISEALKCCNFLPHDIALTLARDIEEVAIPMLQYSEVLTEDDLDEIIKSSKVQKILAIARREKISKATLVRLVSAGFDEVVEAVLANDNLPEETKNTVYTLRSQTQIPIMLGEKIMNEVSTRLVQQINAKYNLGANKKLGTVASHVTEISVLSLIDSHSRNGDIQFLVNHLDVMNRLTHSIILSALCMGRRRFFVCALAKKAKVSMHEASTSIKKTGREGLRALLKLAGIPAKLFDAIELIVRLTDEKKSTDRNISVPDFCSWLLSKLEYFADRTRIEYLSYLMAIAKQTHSEAARG